MENLSGQWLGQYKGKNNGDVILNIELRDKKYQGKVILIDENNKLPSLLASIVITKSKENKYQGNLSDFLSINPYTKLPFTLSELQYFNNLYPCVKIPGSGVIENISIKNDKISGEWRINNDINGTFKAHLAKASKDEKSSKDMKWEEYQKHILERGKHGYIFRGQTEILPLRTTFHRSGRSDISYYTAVDVPRLHRHIAAETGRLYNLDNGFENGALLYLAQHHGYPTPLLDWTHSPFIAAFFAYRAIPQQSITMFTNMDHVEGFIRQKEVEKNKEYLEIINLPSSEIKIVMDDLFQMGISASSMFSGLDGICKSYALSANKASASISSSNASAPSRSWAWPAVK